MDVFWCLSTPASVPRPFNPVGSCYVCFRSRCFFVFVLLQISVPPFGYGGSANVHLLLVTCGLVAGIRRFSRTRMQVSCPRKRGSAGAARTRSRSMGVLYVADESTTHIWVSFQHARRSDFVPPTVANDATIPRHIEEACCSRHIRLCIYASNGKSFRLAAQRANSSGTATNGPVGIQFSNHSHMNSRHNAGG